MKSNRYRDLQDASHSPTPPAHLKDATAFDLLRALMEQESCPICYVTGSMVSRYLEWIAYESVTDPPTRRRLRAALGYCSAHGQAWLGQSDALATAIIYEDVFVQVGQLLQSYLVANRDVGTARPGFVERARMMLGIGRPDTEAGAALAAALLPRQGCPACDHSLEVEARLVSSYVESLENRDFLHAYRQHPVGLCLPHLRGVVREVGDTATLGTLVEAYASNLENNCAQLREVIRKNDHRYSGEPRGTEFSAPARSVEQIGGLLPTQVGVGRSYLVDSPPTGDV